MNRRPMHQGPMFNMPGFNPRDPRTWPPGMGQQAGAGMAEQMGMGSLGMGQRPPTGGPSYVKGLEPNPTWGPGKMPTSPMPQIPPNFMPPGGWQQLPFPIPPSQGGPPPQGIQEMMQPRRSFQHPSYLRDPNEVQRMGPVRMPEGRAMSIASWLQGKKKPQSPIGILSEPPRMDY